MKKQEITLADLPMPDTKNAERQVIADAVSLPEVLPDILDLVSPDMFSSETNRLYWDAVVGLYNSGKQVEPLAVHAICGQEFIRDILAAGLEYATPLSALQHAQILRDASASRKLYIASLRMLEECTRPGYTEEMAASALETATAEMQTDTIYHEPVLMDAINRVAEAIQERKCMAEKGVKWRVPSGIESFDMMNDQGFGPGQLIILAARPSVGKTALMLKMAKTAASAGFPVQIISCEMTEEELTSRLLYSTGYIPQGQLASGDVNWNLFETAAARLSRLPLYINDRSVLLPDIASRLTSAVKRGQCKIAFIDYLQLVKSGLSYGKANRDTEIGAMTSTLKTLAKRLGIPIVVLCQLNRESDKDGRAPELYDLRESGNIEQDADTVLMLKNVEGTQGEDGPPNLAFWVRKNRTNKRNYCLTLQPDATYTEFWEIGSPQY